MKQTLSDLQKEVETAISDLAQGHITVARRLGKIYAKVDKLIEELQQVDIKKPYTDQYGPQNIIAIRHFIRTHILGENQQ